MYICIYIYIYIYINIKKTYTIYTIYDFLIQANSTINQGVWSFQQNTKDKEIKKLSRTFELNLDC